ncbi:MAG: DUF2460 domain-containing protein [Bacilli bacterium]|nr:DUF2460 domain-containing protein [Bacilli bacterium]
MQNRASVNLSNIAVTGESTTATLKYCTLNYQTQGHYDGYKANDSRIDSNNTYNYDAFFLDADNNARTALSFAPGYSFTFALEIEGSSDSQVVITKYLSEASDTYFYKENETRKGFALSRALDVYTQVYSSKPTSSDLYAYFSQQGVIGSDYFNYVESTPSGGTTINQPCSSGFDASSTAYFLMTMYFSDDPSTWYSPAIGSTSESLVGDGSTTVFSLTSDAITINSVELTDSITALGDSRDVYLSTSGTINSVKINGVPQTQGTEYTYNGNVVSFDFAPNVGDQIEVTYIAAPSSYRYVNNQLTFKTAPFNGTSIEINCSHELDYCVPDPVNGSSNVYEGLTVALTDLLIS